MCDLTNPAFTDEDKAREFLEASRWPDGPVCPFCGQLDTVSKLGGKSMGPGWYYCSNCQATNAAINEFSSRECRALGKNCSVLSAKPQ